MKVFFALWEMNCMKDELNIYIVDELDFAFYQGTLQRNEFLRWLITLVCSITHIC